MSQNETEEIRKVQLTGRSTFVVSLPKKWAGGMGLKAGSSLVVSKQGIASLVLTPRELVEPRQPKEGKITVSEKDQLDTIARKIIALYLVGYNLVRILAKDERITSSQRNMIKDLIRRKLVGTEVISDSAKELTMQVLFGYADLSVENALRRMCLIAGSMIEDAIRALKERNSGLAQEIITLDDEVDRFSFYIIRQLKSAVRNEATLRDAGFSSPTDCLGYRVIVKSVERIADHAVKMAEIAKTLQNTPNQSTIRRIDEISTYARSVFEDAVKALYKKDYALADMTVSKAEAIQTLEEKALDAISSERDSARISGMRMIIEHIQRTAQYSSDIAEIVLNLNISKTLVL